MAIPAYVAQLRRRIGNDLLLLPSVCALVFDDDNRILLHRRADTGRWSTINGILDPGEEPAAGAVREVLEETGIRAVPQRITGVYTTPVITYPNGDRAQFVITTFACRAVSGRPRVNDDESLEVAYFRLDALPELRPDQFERIQHALAGGDARFVMPD